LPDTRSIRRLGPGKQLLQKLSGNPSLPVFIRQLDTPVLNRLIEHVGLADATELIALTTPEQMRELFEVTLWESLIPGQSETHRPEKFLEWLDAMLAVGQGFAAGRLVDLGEDFIVLNLQPLIRVLEASVMSAHADDAPACQCTVCGLEARDAAWDIIGDYIVIAHHEDEWDSIRALLLQLDQDESGLLQRVLSRCCLRASVRGFADSGEATLADATWERETRREQRGFVTPQMASTFLKTAQAADRDVLLSARNYDPVTRHHFDQLHAAGSHAQPEPSTEMPDPDQAAAPDASAAQLRALEQILAESDVISARPLLLAGPASSDEWAMELQTHLDRLQYTDATTFTARLGELVYLANVLMAGSWFQGERFTEPEAARAALACANLGLDWLLNEAGATQKPLRTRRIESLLEEAPGIVRLFQVGWNLLQSLPRRCGQSLLDALQADHVRAQLHRKQWILDEINSAISDPDLLLLIDQGEFEDVRDNLVLLTLVLDPRACRCLQALIADFPRYPVQLNLGLHHKPLDTREVRYLSTMQQLQRVELFLAEIDRYLKVDG
jgi:Family of unknown function (DUF6178)